MNRVIFSPRSSRNTIKIRSPCLKQQDSNSETLATSSNASSSISSKNSSITASRSREILESDFEKVLTLDLIKSHSQEFEDDSVILTLENLLSPSLKPPSKQKKFQLAVIPNPGKIQKLTNPRNP
jgi:hypothetical protein